MDLREYVDVLRRRWRFVVVCVLLGLVAAAAATALMPRTYTAKAQLFIATNDNDSANAYAGGLFTQQRVKSYTQIANSPAVLGGVIGKLDLNTTPQQLAKKISAQAPLDTTLVDIKVQDRSATRAQAIADETAAQFTRYIGSIEKTSADEPALVKASVVGNPDAPTAPASPRPALNAAIGLLGGIVVGATGAVLRNSLDTTVRSAGDARRRLDVATLGALPRPARRRGDTGHRNGGVRRNEALSQLRTRLRVPRDGMPSSLLISSAVHGEGRTDTAIDLAANVARTGRRVVLVEGDLRRPRLAATLGLREGPGLTDVVTGGAELSHALQPWEAGQLRVLPSGTPLPDPAALLSSRYLRQLLRALEAEADLVVLDSPPVLPFADAAILAGETESALVVVRIGRTKYDQVHRALENLASAGARTLGAVVTAAPPDRRTGPHPRQAPQQHRAPEPEDRTAPAADGVRAPAGRSR
ncbi:polysaccharide biosynthesis tyrosine autokinase [Streptomyces coeruleorubidus]|uniref:polysaccharide biosynthesis tyrosine autokinase n=1 Tax=Streptomyces coeruleorubidus TaxID=116188 RepID=UPI00237F593F|nr:polysaccharide biosynthesis tyrosine autokinase [Streptomyces coeruleorubidus]WDV55948.1 polysaccharide biosynthesis tyrosine autokinase [Streptomyces coeruleorubidus]